MKLHNLKQHKMRAHILIGYKHFLVALRILISKDSLTP